MIDKLNELCLWLSHQKGMMSQDYAKELAKIIVQLRQQADRIAELEKQTFFIADPEKQGEPVAWMLADKQNECIRSILAVQHDFVPEGCVEIPLYTSLVFCTTPQTKPLSDEEIYALWCEADNTELLPEMRLKDGSINYIITTFAKVIEERHGIK